MQAPASFLDLARSLLRRGQQQRAQARAVSLTGIPALDRLLPEAGLPEAGLVEWLAEAAGGGMAFSLLTAARRLQLREHAHLVVIDPSRQFHPVTLPAWGVPLDRLALIRPANAHEALWAWEQSLRSSGVAACLGLLPEVSPVALRRLQLAAEHGESLGLLVRPPAVARQPSWANVRWRVTPLAGEPNAWSRSPLLGGRRFRVELLRCRGEFSGGVAIVELNHDATGVPVVSPVADSAIPLRPAGCPAAAARAS